MIRSQSQKIFRIFLPEKLPQWIEEVKNVAPAKTGFLLFPLPLMSVTIALLIMPSVVVSYLLFYSFLYFYSAIK